MDSYSTPSNKMLQLQRCLSFSVVKFLSAINSKSKIIYICLPNSLSSCMLHFTMISCSTLAGFFSSYRASVGPDRSSLHHSAPVQIHQARRVTFSDFHPAQHQCHTSHLGSQLPYQCNLGPCIKLQKHLIQRNYIQSHACRSVPMFTIFLAGQLSSEIVSLPCSLLLDYSTFEFTTLLYPTRK